MYAYILEERRMGTWNEFAKLDLSCVEVNFPSCLTFLQWTTEQYLIGIISRIANPAIVSMGVP